MSIQNQATSILNDFRILIEGYLCEICEIELYLNSEDHPDPYVHQSYEQKQYGKWYFHRAKTKYKGGTFKGLDLTMGTPSQYYSWLIRSIYHPKVGMITGPCNVVNFILKTYNIKTIEEFVGSLDCRDCLNVLDNPRHFYMVKLDHSHIISSHKKKEDHIIYHGPRIGLNPDKDSYWAGVHYRFCKYYRLIKKDKRSLKVLHTDYTP